MLSLTAAGCPRADPVDLLFRGATVIDGTGASGYVADVAVRDGRVIAVGALDSTRAVRAIDASGRLLTPGFIDMHSHADLILLGDAATQQRLLQAKIAQGITSVVVGNCGLGVAPTDEASAELVAAINGWMTPQDVEAGPLSVGAYFDRLQTTGVALNVAALVPHGPVRISVMGLQGGAPDPVQLERMRRLVSVGLEQGALGLSTGLIYPPGMFSPTGELVHLAREVARRDRLFTSHVRGSSSTLLAATRELIEIARESGARTHHSHLEAVGREHWPEIRQVLELEDRARDEGLRISHDVFLYTRAATMMAAIFPPWALEDGMPGLLQRLERSGERARMRIEMETLEPHWPTWVEGGWPHNLVRAVGWDGIRVASVGPGGPTAMIGRSLEQLGEQTGHDAFDVVADLMLSQHGQVGQFVDEISGSDDERAPLLSILAHPAAAIVSDAEDFGRGTPHPAHAGGFARALRWNRETGLLPIETLIRRMTGYPAALLGLEQRGRIAPGLPADLVLFDAELVSDAATWDRPRERAVGIEYVVINGTVVVDPDGYRGGLAGRLLRSEP